MYREQIYILIQNSYIKKHCQWFVSYILNVFWSFMMKLKFDVQTRYNQLRFFESNLKIDAIAFSLFDLHVHDWSRGI